jgi:hypothetical protein
MVDFLMERIGLESTAVGRGVEVDGGGNCGRGDQGLFKAFRDEPAGRAVFFCRKCRTASVLSLPLPLSLACSQAITDLLLGCCG